MAWWCSAGVPWGDPGYNALQLADSGTTLVVGTGYSTIRGTYGTVGYASEWGGSPDVGVVNQGPISADVNGGSIAVTAQPFSNQGLAQGINGGTLELAGTWSNMGTLSGSGGALSLGGSFNFADLGSVNDTNGAIYISGTLNNTNGTRGSRRRRTVP